MKAIILAAGFGTRLRPLTNSLPKALVKITNKTLLEIVIGKLYSAGFDEIYINVHAFAGQIEHFIKTNPFHANITLFHEKEILETGGGIRNIVKSLSTDEPVLVHNVDVLTDLDLDEFYNYHIAERACITLAIQKRITKRYLVFDKKNQLCGRGHEDRKKANLIKQPVGEIGFYGFNGIQVISRILQLLSRLIPSTVQDPLGFLRYRL